MMTTACARLALLLAIFGHDKPAEPESIGRLDHPEIQECSGIVASRRHPGIFWVHNDSGNPPALFAVRRDGRLVRSYKVAAPNVDWEDIAIDDGGRLYLGDIGNNGGRLPLRAIYRIPEPDPAVEPTGPLAPDLTLFYRFDDKGRFDAEGLFVDAGRVWLVAKARDGRDAALWSLPIDRPAPLLRPARPEPAGTLPGFDRPATGADLSADGRRLAVCSTDRAVVYRRGPDGWEPEATIPYPERQVEAIAWDGNDLIIASEDRRLSRLALPIRRGGRR